MKNNRWIGLILRMAAGGVLAAVCVAGLPLALGMGANALFTAWNVNERTLPYAPAWAAWLYGNAGTLIGGICLLALNAAGLLVCRLGGISGSRKQIEPKRLWIWLILPLLAVLTVLLADSMRLPGGLSHAQPGALLRLPLIALTALSEGIWLQRYVRGAFRKAQLPEWAGGTASAVLFALMTCLGARVSVLLVLNMLFTGVLLTVFSENAAGFALRRFLLLAVTGCLFVPEGGAGVFTLLDVSEPLWTGGTLGICAGLLWTVLLAIVCWLRYMDEINRFVKRVMAKPQPDRPEFHSGKRSRRG